MKSPPLVYIAGPFSAPTREGVEVNISVAVKWGLKVAAIGGMPVIPHANTSHPEFEKLQPYQFWIAGTMALLRACDAILMIPGSEGSSGAKGEFNDVVFRGGRVFHHSDMLELERWIAEWSERP